MRVSRGCRKSAALRQVASVRSFLAVATAASAAGRCPAVPSGGIKRRSSEPPPRVRFSVASCNYRTRVTIWRGGEAGEPERHRRRQLGFGETTRDVFTSSYAARLLIRWSRRRSTPRGWAARWSSERGTKGGVPGARTGVNPSERVYGIREVMWLWKHRTRARFALDVLAVARVARGVSRCGGRRRRWLA
jgi:hypothetical protein